MEVESRTEVLLEDYIKILHIEALTMLEIAKRGIVPAVLECEEDVAGTLRTKMEISDKISHKLEDTLLGKLTALADALTERIDALEAAVANAPEGEETLKLASYFGGNVIAAMAALRETVDALELIVDDRLWPLPNYGEILYSVK